MLHNFITKSRTMREEINEQKLCYALMDSLKK